MLTYVFENNGVPMYEQLYEYLKDDITKGILKTDEKLPSKRAFARNNGISTITVQNAYNQLQSEGYIYSLTKKGYYVANLCSLRKLSADTKLSLDIKLPPSEEECEINFSNNNIKPENFPFSVWSRLSREVMSQKSREVLIQSPTGGILELRESIAEHLKAFRGMLIDPNQIIVGAGTEYLYGLLIQLLGTKRNFCIENPGYKKLKSIYSQYGANCVLADIDRKGVTVQELNRVNAQIVHISPNHHFPTGITMPADRRYEILSWANETSDRYIIEDDYDSEFRLSGKIHPTLFSIDGCEKVIYMNTFSKTLTPTIRISYMVLPIDLANRFYQELSFYSCTVSNFEQYTLSLFINRGYFEKHINRMRLYYLRRRREVIELLYKSSLKDNMELIENESGLHFLMKLKTDIDDETIKRELLKRKIRISPLSDYYMTGKAIPHHFVINYSSLDIKKLGTVFETLNRVIHLSDFVTQISSVK